MNQTGRVKSVSPQKTVISIVRETACGENCASCSAKCSLKNAEVVAQTVSGINVGDMVIFEMPASKVLFAAFLVYITPLIVLFLSYSLSVVFGVSEEYAALAGVFCMSIWFFIIHFIDKHLKKYYKHKIVQKIEGDEFVRI